MSCNVQGVKQKCSKDTCVQCLCWHITSGPLHSSALVRFVFYSSAVVWGTSVKYNPQRVGKDHELNDEDVVQVVKR